MAFGYGLAHLAYRDADVRWRPLVGFGAGFLVVFVIARWLDRWEPSPWSIQQDWRFTLLSLVRKRPHLDPTSSVTTCNVLGRRGTGQRVERRVQPRRRPHVILRSESGLRAVEVESGALADS